MKSILCFILSLSIIGLPVSAQEPVMLVGPAHITTIETKTGHINNLSDSIYLSFPSDVQTLGPKFPMNEKENLDRAQSYVQWTFREIIRRAHGLIEDKGEYGYNPEGDVNFSYFSFLVLALTVPHHESHLMHFREQLSEKCSDKANSLSAAGFRTRKVLGQIYRDPAEPLLPDCKVLQDFDKISQLILSYTYEDIGIMQVNPYWHISAMEPSVLLNTANFIQYGIEYLFDGYITVRSKIDKNPNYYPCSMDTDPYKTKESTPKIFYNLLRATWASKYNSGKKSKICRFISTNKYDDGFEAALNSIVVGSTSIYHRYLPENSLEMAVLREIVNNYYRIFIPGVQPEQSENLKVLLSMPERRHQNWTEPKRIVKNEPTHTLLEAKIPIYSSPGAKDSKVCGYLDTRGMPSSSVKVISEEFYSIVSFPKPQRWAELSVSEYALYLNYHGVKKYVALKDSKNVVNLRTEAGNLSPETKVDQLIRNDEGISASLEFAGYTKVGNATWLEMKNEKAESLFAHGDFVQIIEEKTEPPRSCRLDSVFVESEKLRHLPIEYEHGESFRAVVNGTGGLNVRRCAGLQCDVLSSNSLSSGDLITVIGDDSLKGKRVVSWYQIILQDSTEAWVWAERVDLIEKSKD